MRRVTNRLENPDEYFLFLAHVVGMRATCSRRRVGCVLVNDQKHIRSTGYNGVTSGTPHCLDSPCPGAEAPSGTMLEYCYAVHAEINALQQLDEANSALTAYVTVTPCLPCAEAIVENSLIKAVVTSSVYADTDGLDYLKANGIIHKIVGIDGDQIIETYLGGIK
jgi:dCMP deaminase